MKLTPIVVVAMSVMFSTPLQAQWSIGGVAGINLASISVDPQPSSESYSSMVGFGIGAVVDRVLADNIDLHLEPMFQQKGSKLEEGGDDTTLKLSYLEVPVMIRYHFPGEGSAKPFVMAGPSVGILMSAKYEFDGGGEFDAKDETNSVDFGVGVGGGVTIPRGDKTLFCEARYVLGLSNFNEEEGESSAKNRGFQLFVGATVPVGR